MKIFLSILGIILALAGVVWFLQGISVLLGSVMTGQPQWTYIGVIAFVVGIGLLLFANLRKSSSRKSDNTMIE